MIVLDTHIWIWWVDGHARLPKHYHDYLQEQEDHGFGVSIISCWEVAKLVEYQRLILACPVEAWITTALQYPGIELLELTPRIVVESSQLPGIFHRDPADQLIVATARVYDCPVITVDSKIRGYPHVKTRP